MMRERNPVILVGYCVGLLGTAAGVGSAGAQLSVVPIEVEFEFPAGWPPLEELVYVRPVQTPGSCKIGVQVRSGDRTGLAVFDCDDPGAVVAASVRSDGFGYRFKDGDLGRVIGTTFDGGDSTWVERSFPGFDFLGGSHIGANGIGSHFIQDDTVVLTEQVGDTFYIGGFPIGRGDPLWCHKVEIPPGTGGDFQFVRDPVSTERGWVVHEEEDVVTTISFSIDTWRNPKEDFRKTALVGDPPEGYDPDQFFCPGTKHIGSVEAQLIESLDGTQDTFVTFRDEADLEFAAVLGDFVPEASHTVRVEPGGRQLLLIACKRTAPPEVEGNSALVVVDPSTRGASAVDLGVDFPPGFGFGPSSGLPDPDGQFFFLYQDFVTSEQRAVRFSVTANDGSPSFSNIDTLVYDKLSTGRLNFSIVSLFDRFLAGARKTDPGNKALALTSFEGWSDLGVVPTPVVLDLQDITDRFEVTPVTNYSITPSNRLESRVTHLDAAPDEGVSVITPEVVVVAVRNGVRPVEELPKITVTRLPGGKFELRWMAHAEFNYHIKELIDLVGSTRPIESIPGEDGEVVRQYDTDAMGAARYFIIEVENPEVNG